MAHRLADARLFGKDSLVKQLSASDWLLVALIALCLIPIWAFPFFPSQDAPSHLENASVLLHYGNPALPFQEFYALNFASPTNWLGHIVLALLMTVAPPTLAEKLFLSAYVILFPLAVRYALGGMQVKGATRLAILTFPVIYTFVLYKGFYNFCASLPLYFFLLGYWLRNRDALTPAAILALAALSFLLYAAHVVAWVMGALALGLLTLWFAVPALRTHKQSLRQVVVQRFLPCAVILVVPGILLLFFLTRGTGTPFRPDWNWSVALWNLVRYSSLAALDEREYTFAWLFTLGIALLCVYQIIRRVLARESSVWDVWLALAALYLFVYLITPSSLEGGGFVKQRLMLFVLFPLILWLGAQTYTAGLLRVVQAAATIWLVGLLVVRLGAHRELNAELQDVYAVSSQLMPGSTIVPLVYASHVQEDDDSSLLSHIRYMLHSVGYAAAEHDLMDLSNYEARTDYFPLRYRAAHNPAAYVKGLSSGSPRLDLAGLEQHTGAHVEYVLLVAEDAPFGATFQPPDDLLAELDRNFEPVGRSPLGYARLYRRKSG